METTNKDLITISKDDLFNFFNLAIAQLRSYAEQNNHIKPTNGVHSAVKCETDFSKLQADSNPKKKESKRKSPKDLWTVKQVSDYTAYKTSTIYAFVNQEKIPYIKLNGRLFFDKEAIDQWLRVESN